MSSLRIVSAVKSPTDGNGMTGKIASAEPSTIGKRYSASTFATSSTFRGSSSSIRTSCGSSSEILLLKPTKEVEKDAKIRESLNSLQRLKFEQVPIIGRSNEIATLKDRFKRLTAAATTTESTDDAVVKKNDRELILLSGYSGTGKTTLAETLRSEVRCHDGCFVYGKYSKSHNSSSSNHQQDSRKPEQMNW